MARRPRSGIPLNLDSSPQDGTKSVSEGSERLAVVVRHRAGAQQTGRGPDLNVGDGSFAPSPPRDPGLSQTKLLAEGGLRQTKRLSGLVQETRPNTILLAVWGSRTHGSKSSSHTKCTTGQPSPPQAVEQLAKNPGHVGGVLVRGVDVEGVELDACIVGGDGRRAVVGDADRHGLVREG